MIEAERDDAVHIAIADTFAETAANLRSYCESQREQAKVETDSANRKEKKSIQKKWNEKLAWNDELLTIAEAALWLYDKFEDGVYSDIPGLCKIAAKEEINEKGYSLTPGAYVGVAPEEDDGVDFEERVKEIHKELLELQAESNQLMDIISENLKEIGL